MNGPLVSCAMVTGHDPRRRSFVTMSLRAFDRQDYPRREFVILNQAGERWFPNRPDIREILVPPGILGTCRREIVSHCLGDAVVAWDDDDIPGYARVRKQVEAWQAFGGKAVLLSSMATWDVASNVRRIVDASRWRCGGYPGTVMFSRDDPPEYSDLAVGEDSHGVMALFRRGRVVAIPNHPMDYVRRIHGANSWPPEHYQRLMASGVEPTREVTAGVDAIAWLERQDQCGPPAGPASSLEQVSQRLNGLRWMRLPIAHRIASAYAAVPHPDVLEIGHLWGASTCYLAAMAQRRGGLVTSLDLARAAHTIPRAEDALAACGLHAVLLRSERGSDALLPRLHADNRRYGLVVVDGAHVDPQVSRDVAWARRLLVPGGVLVMDDIANPNYPDVAEAWRRLSGWGGQRIEYQGVGLWMS